MRLYFTNICCVFSALANCNNKLAGGAILAHLTDAVCVELRFNMFRFSFRLFSLLSLFGATHAQRIKSAKTQLIKVCKSKPKLSKIQTTNIKNCVFADLLERSNSIPTLSSAKTQLIKMYKNKQVVLFRYTFFLSVFNQFPLFQVTQFRINSVDSGQFNKFWSSPLN